MPSINQCIVFLTMALSVSGLATPQARNVHHHRAVAAHMAAPLEPMVVPQVTGAPTPKRMIRRSTNSHCKARPSTSGSAASTTVPVNVAPTVSLKAVNPTTASSSKHSTTIHSSSKAQTTTVTHSSSKAHTTTTTHSSSKAHTTTTSAKPKSTGSSSALSYMTGTQTGQGTYYATGLGACGITNKDTDYIAAVSHLLYDTYPGYKGGNPNDNPVCGKKVKATYKGKSVTVAITDRCTGCALTDLDFSPSAFSQLANQALGRISGMEWVWE